MNEFCDAPTNNTTGHSGYYHQTKRKDIAFCESLWEHFEILKKVLVAVFGREMSAMVVFAGKTFSVQQQLKKQCNPVSAPSGLKIKILGRFPTEYDSLIPKAQLY